MNQIFYITVLVQCLAVDLGRLRANLFDIQVLCGLQITEDQIQCQFHIQCGQHLKKNIGRCTLHLSFTGMKIWLWGSPGKKYLLDVHTTISCRACLGSKPSEVNTILPEYRILFNQPSGIHRENSVTTDYLQLSRGEDWSNLKVTTFKYSFKIKTSLREGAGGGIPQNWTKSLPDFSLSICLKKRKQ